MMLFREGDYVVLRHKKGEIYLTEKQADFLAYELQDAAHDIKTHTADYSKYDGQLIQGSIEYVD